MALAIFALSVGALLVMSVAVYTAFDRELQENLNDTVHLRAASNARLVDPVPSPPRLTAGPDTGDERSDGDAILRLFDTSGVLLVDASPAAPTGPEEDALVRRALSSGSDVSATIHLLDGKGFRAVASPVRSGDEVAGILVSGVEMAQVEEPLAVLRLILAVAVPVTSIVVALGGYWIARSALQPVSRITATANQIASGDLRSRIQGVRSRDEIGELATTLNAMIARLAETVERERRFTADASHELRTPLAAIETSIDVMLNQERSPEDYRYALGAVRGQTRRLATLSRQLLLLSRLDSVDAQPGFENMDLSTLVEAVASTFADSNPGARLTVDIVPDLVVFGDVELLARAVLNILENAVAHAGPSVAISLALARVPGQALASIVISDDGPGIEPGLAAEVFQRFRRGDSSRSSGGTGLGLAIVESIMTLHGGKARLEAGDSPGARFLLTLPLVPGE